MVKKINFHLSFFVRHLVDLISWCFGQLRESLPQLQKYRTIHEITRTDTKQRASSHFRLLSSEFISSWRPMTKGRDNKCASFRKRTCPPRAAGHKCPI